MNETIIQIIPPPLTSCMGMTEGQRSPSPALP